MKKFTSLLIGCSLALAGAAMAQQPDGQASPNPKHADKGKGHTEEAKHGTNEMKPHGPGQHDAKNTPQMQKAESAPKPEPSVAQRQGDKHGPKSAKMEKAATTPNPAPSVAAKTAVAGQPAASASATPDAKKQAEERRKGAKNPAIAAKPSATPATAAATPAPTASAAPSVAPAAQAKTAGQPKELANKIAAAKKPAPQQVQQIKAEHANFHAQPKPQLAPAVTFNPNHRIEGSDRWQGQQYEAFRSYHPERHDEGWYHSHYSRVELIGGGYYYQNNGYWYPAWGYRPSAEYYAYDGPIYVGHRSEPPDQVIADVQSALQQTGYYKGEVDGLLGPLTREALTSYQDDQGLPSTAAIDEPTLDALGMGS